MNSYQRRLRDIKYLEQCVYELEHTCKEIVKAKGCPPLPLLSGITGDQFITPYNNGEFAFALLTIKPV